MPTSIKFSIIDKMDEPDLELRLPENSKYVTGSGRRRTMHMRDQRIEPLRRIQQQVSTRLGERNSLNNLVVDQSFTRTNGDEAPYHLHITPDHHVQNKSYLTS